MRTTEPKPCGCILIICVQPAWDGIVHYLQKELLKRMRSDMSLFEFFDESGLDGLWFLDMETMEDEWYSPKFAAVLGYEPHEVPNKAWWWQERIHPDDLTPTLQSLERHLADPSAPFDQIVRYFHRDGHLVSVRCRGKVLQDETGKPVRMLGTHTDITDLREAEEALRKSNVTLRVFAATVSHDLKAPMRHVGVIADLARSKIHAGDTDAAIELLDKLNAASTRAMGIVDGLLRLSEVQRYNPPQEARANLHDCARYAADTVGSEGTDIHIDPLPEISGDAELLTTLLSNLIANAVKYNDKPHTHIHVRSFTEGGHLVVQVDDNGPGIPVSEQERIFQPLERGVASSGVDGHGIGLGRCVAPLRRRTPATSRPACPNLAGLASSFVCPAP
jgi:PAS domain S-box-containing protein